MRESCDVLPTNGSQLERGPTWSRLIGLLGTRPLTFEEERKRLLYAAVATLGGVLLVVAMALLDLDHFKGINDRHGHAAGDDVLRECSKRIRDCLRAYDRVGRWGGEEFLLVFLDPDPEGLSRVLERIRESIAETPVVSGGTTIPVTASVGVAASRGSEVTAETLIELADRALYAAKEAGRNAVVIAESEVGVGGHARRAP